MSSTVRWTSLKINTLTCRAQLELWELLPRWTTTSLQIQSICLSPGSSLVRLCPNLAPDVHWQSAWLVGLFCCSGIPWNLAVCTLLCPVLFIQHISEVYPSVAHILFIHSFVLLGSTFCGCNTMWLFLVLLVDLWDISSVDPWWIKLLHSCVPVRGHLFSPLLGKW